MNKNLKQLGGELQKERKAHDVTLQTIAEQTKISLTFLQAMEAGDFGFLPAPYPRNFLRSYLQCLGGRQDRFLNRFDEFTRTKSTEPVQQANAAPADRQEPNTVHEMIIKDPLAALRSKRWSLSIVGTAIVLIVLTVLSVSKNDDRMPVHNSVNGQTVVPQDSQLAAAAISPFSFKKKELHLSLIASQKTWMQIAIDDSAATEYIFNDGDSSVWQAKERFLLRIGNGAGVRLYLNGNDLGPLGRERAVVNLLLTEDGIQENQF